MSRVRMLRLGVVLAAVSCMFVLAGPAAATTTSSYLLRVNSGSDNNTCAVVGHYSSGPCTLRGAIKAANGLGPYAVVRIYVLPGVKTIHLWRGALTVDSPRSIVQIFGHQTVIDGSGNPAPSSVFMIESSTQISGVRVQGGTGNAGDNGYGGGFYVKASLDLSDSVVEDNTACDSYTGPICNAGDSYQDGGGIYVGGNDTEIRLVLTLSRVTVTGNKAYEGGGIYDGNNYGTTVLIESSHVDGNTACGVFTGNGVCTGEGYGGGIYNSGEMVTVDNSTVDDNTAGSPSTSQGGGGGIYQWNDNMQLSNTEVADNVAGSYGGGIYADDSIGLVGSQVTGNLAGEYGGGMENDYYANIVSSTFMDNRAGGTFECTAGSGGTACQNQTGGYSTVNCATLYPHATTCSATSGYGGGIANYYNLAVTGSTLDHNIAVTDGNYPYCGGGQGGGLYTDWALTLVGSHVASNIAGCGGGIYNADNETLAVLNTSLVTNHALQRGGALFDTGAIGATLIGVNVNYNVAGTSAIFNSIFGSVLARGLSFKGNIGSGTCINLTLPCT